VEQWAHKEKDVRANWPDMIIKNKNEKTCVLTDVPILAGGSVTQREAEN
jgi:triosephosphate isomerase